jgi:hypothetical protein
MISQMTGFAATSLLFGIDRGTLLNPVTAADRAQDEKLKDTNHCPRRQKPAFAARAPSGNQANRPRSRAGNREVTHR